MVAKPGLVLDTEAGQPLYRQIADDVARRIRSGEYPAGFRLPTTRMLARELKVHRNTAVRAYEELVSQGLVHSVVGRGTTVAARPGPPDSGARVEGRRRPWSALISASARAEPFGRLDRLARQIGTGDHINLLRLHPSPDLLPTNLLRQSFDSVLKTIGAEALGYGPVAGLGRLRSLISEGLRNAGIPAREEDVVVTTGSQQALDLVARVLINPGDTVLAEEHVYPGAISAFTAAGARIVAIPSDEEGPDMAFLGRVETAGVKALFVMANCSNPTGRCIGSRRRQEIVEWSSRTGVPVVDDDYGADLGAAELPAPMRALDPETVYLGTFSKKLSPALRVGFVLSPPALVRQLTAFKQCMDLGTSLLHQHVLADFIEKGRMKAHLKRIQTAYRRRRDVLLQGLKENLPEGITWRCPEHGVLCWLRLPAAMDPEDVFTEALNQGVLVSPGTYHNVYPEAAPGVRLTFCAETEDRLAEAARRLRSVFANLNRPAATAKELSGAPSMDGV